MTVISLYCLLSLLGIVNILTGIEWVTVRCDLPLFDIFCPFQLGYMEPTLPL